MSIRFAEEILDGMVDENGHCGERGLSEKQFDILAQYLESEGTEQVGAWHGNRGGKVRFYDTYYAGVIGKYTVVLNEYEHFHRRCTVVEINRRPQEEIDRENRLRELGKFEHSEWVGEPKKRMELELTLVRDYTYERQAYGYSYGYHPETVHVYTMADADGNCIVWKTAGHLGVDIVKEISDDGTEWLEWVPAEPGDKVTMRATVKEHGEYKGVKQTVIARPKISGIEKAA